MIVVKYKRVKMNKKIKIPKTSVRAKFEPDSYNEEERTVEVVFSTGAKGKRFSWSVGEYFEELSMKKSDIKLERLNAGAPVLNNHQRYNGLEGILGVVEKALVRKGEGIAVIRFSEREELQGIIKDIRSGVIRNVSIGYTVNKYEDVSKKNDEVPTFRATDWEPYEISFVDVPFDIESQSRSGNKETAYECVIEENEESLMNKEQQIRAAVKNANLSETFANELIKRDIELSSLKSEITKKQEELRAAEKVKDDPVVVPKTNTEPVVNKEEERKLGAEEERKRIYEINSAARALGVESEVIDKHMKDGTSADNFRKLMIEEKSKADSAKKTNSHNVEGGDVNTRELRMNGAENALMNRFASDKHELSEEGKQFRGMGLVDLGRALLEAEGISCQGLHKNEIATRSLHSSSDFKNILANVANKSLRAAYSEGPQTFGFMTRSVVVDDFKEISRTQFGDAPVLEKVNENGEFRHGTISDAAEKYSLETFGKIIKITRKTIINDDLAAFTRIPEMFGRRARDLESEKIWAILASNPQMADGFNLFSAEHGNLAAGGDVGIFDVPKVGKGREAMRLQTGLDGLLIDVMPKHLVTPVALETQSEQFLGATVPQINDNVNPFKSKLSPVSEPRLDKYSKTAWYLAASTDQIDMIEVARLAGEEGPTLSSREGFEVDGMQIKIRYDFAAKVLDHRGFYKNPGV